jgi:uncharacterized protein YkwD
MILHMSLSENRFPPAITSEASFSGTIWSLFRGQGRAGKALMTRRRFERAALARAAAPALVALALASCASDRDPTLSQPTFYTNLAQAGAALDAQGAAAMISNYRANNGLATLAIDPQLMRLAQDQAQAMAARNKMDHDVAGPFKARITRSGFDAKVAAENISAGYHTMAEAFSGWRDSPHHRANMLLKGATHMGIAAVYAPGTKYRVFWALILAAPDDKRG